jgi:putative aminopeptidase FrvX
MNKSSQDFLEKYLNTQSPTGWESEGQKVWLDYIKPYIDKYEVDAYGSVVGIVNPEAEYKVVIEAHADEIGWTVFGIDSNGYLSVVRNGGSDHQVAPGMPVKIITKTGYVEGVFGWLAIHERKGKGAISPDVDKLYVDVGASSKEEVEKMGVHIGSVLTYDTKYKMLNNTYHLSRALDNRMGGYVIAETLRKLKKKNVELPFGLYVVNSVQEEIGLRGAKMVAERIKPDVAIVTDVCHDSHSPLYNPKLAGDVKCGKGPVLWYGADNQRNLVEMITSVAEKKDIEYQVSTYNGNSGTDTSAFYQANGGVVSALMSFPLKYMHTSVEMVHNDDVEKAIKLLYHFLKRLDAGHDFRYIK